MLSIVATHSDLIFVRYVLCCSLFSNKKISVKMSTEEYCLQILLRETW